MKKAIRLKDLADELNVSITTVSKALNNHPDISPKRRKEILEYAEKRNYVPNQVARSFRQQKTKMIGIVLSDNSNPYNARVLKGIEKTLSVHGYHCLIMNNAEDVEKEVRLVNELRGLNVSGVLIMPAAGNREGCALLKKYDIPYVLINRYIDKDQDTYVVLNDYQAAYMSAKHLCGYGNEKIFFLNFLSSVSSAKERLQGYEQALRDSGIEPDPNWVIADCVDQMDGYETMKRILEKNTPPFSVMCYSDYIAIGAICAIQERGYEIPYDIAVMGNDDIGILSFVKPRLSTIGVPKMRMGIKSAELLLEILERREKEMNEEAVEEYQEQHIVMKPELIIRETS